MDIGLLLLVGGVILFFIIFFSFIPIPLWISAISAGVKVSLTSLVAMRPAPRAAQQDHLAPH